MEYHEIREKFEYDGVVLEVVEGTGLWTEDCVNCEVKKIRELSHLSSLFKEI